MSADNPLAGLEGRALLLNRLGAAIELDPERFGQPARLGNLYDYLKGQAQRRAGCAARTILITLLESLGDHLARADRARRAQSRRRRAPSRGARR